jgi:hypothetical protein
MSSLGINLTQKVLGNHDGNSGNVLGMPASATAQTAHHQHQSATIAERAQQCQSSMTTAPPLNTTTISSKRSIVDFYNHVPISQQTHLQQQQQPQHLLQITQHQQHPPLPLVSSTGPFVVHTPMPVTPQQEQPPLPRISSKQSIVAINNQVPISTHQAQHRPQHQHHQLQITQQQLHSQLPVISSRVPTIVVPKQLPVRQQQGPITQPQRPQPPAISSKKSIVVHTKPSFMQQQRPQRPDLSSKQSIAVHTQMPIMQQLAQRHQEQQPPVPQTAPKTPFVMHTQLLPIMQPQTQQQMQRITQQQPPPFAPPYFLQQQHAPLTHTSCVAAKLPNGLAGPGGGINLTGGGIVNAVAAGPAGGGLACRKEGISAAPASSALAHGLAAPAQERCSLPGLQKTAVGYSAASRATMTSQQTLLPTVTVIRKMEDNALAGRRTKSAPGLQQGNGNDTNAYKYRKVVGGKKEIPRAMSLLVSTVQSSAVGCESPKLAMRRTQ